MSNTTNISRVKGFADLFSPESDIFSYMETMAAKVFSSYGYSQLRIPLLEKTELFTRSIGGETDVVQKEMYTFIDKGDRSLTLRPEATAGVMRAYIEDKHYNLKPISKFFTFGPMFRYERPQKGRMRQFHQINCECLGVEEPLADAEIIFMLMAFLDELQITDLSLELNSLGCHTCRPNYKAALKTFFAGLNQEQLCPDCNCRLDSNPMRVLDCKIPSCKDLTGNAPILADYLCHDCQKHFQAVIGLIKLKKLNYTINPRLVRGLDYYTRTTFEIVSNKIGSQGSVAGGGRYDNLIKTLGGENIPNIPGIGFACGMERLAMLLPELSLPRPDFFLAVLDNNALNNALCLAVDLRKKGFNGELSFYAKSLKSQIRQAGRNRVKYCLILGSNELENKTIQVKNMDSGEQIEVKQSDINLGHL